ncbi:MAG: sugar ABC transporter permease [Anaerolineae bacterium]|nr:sugar ABC transporter permease [Anaerolineae bacterium]NUQ05535.1 sugar ABC transporter permease [Anaerolineae bacterium]
MAAQDVTAYSSSAAPPRAGTLTMMQRQRRWGIVFLSPWVFGFLVFTLFPMLASLYFSFTNFKIGEPIEFIGLTNWARLFTEQNTSQALFVTFRFALISTPIAIGLPLLMASLLNSKMLVAKPLLRVLFYMPYMVPAVSSIFIWQSFLNGQTGWLNRLLRLIGIADPPNWLFDPTTLTWGLVLLGLWGVGNAMLTMLASMQGVPTELYEAADVDGANTFTKWYRITLPLISPVILYNLVLAVIGLMNYFLPAYVLSNTTRSNPETNFFNLNLYRTAFQFNEMGFASAQAWFIFLIALLLTVVIFGTSNRWVYYSGGDR